MTSLRDFRSYGEEIEGAIAIEKFPYSRKDAEKGNRNS